MYADSSKPSTRPAVTVPKLRQMKAAGERIVSLTAYDASFARLMDGCGVDVVLVGDSLGMVVQGHASHGKPSLQRDRDGLHPFVPDRHQGR